MIDRIREALARRKVSAWQIRETRRRSHQLFLAQNERESLRTVDTETCLVSVFQNRKADGKTPWGGETVLGMSTFKISPRSAGDIEKYLDDALFAAGLVSNQPFELPEHPAALPEVVLADRDLSAASLDQFETRLKAALARERGVRLSSAEFFIDLTDTRIVNHRGLDVSQSESALETEFILLARAGEQENEYISRYGRRLNADFDIEGEAAKSARYAREATQASLPKTGSFPVLLSEEPLDHLFNPIVARASGRLKYNRMITSEVGRPVVADGPAQGDMVTLWSNGLLSGARGSGRFDSYGTPAARVCLVKDNVLAAYLADKRYADYLGLPVTGELGNVEVAPGKTPFSTLTRPESSDSPVLYHLQAFSAFEPNSITGAFSAEIRAGYEISAGGVRPIKGGSVSGVLHRDLLHCRLSSERSQRERALVPAGILFHRLTIAGA